MKIAILFPGIGYHCDKPLLYYSGKLCTQYQYETVKLTYTNLSRSIPEAFEQAYAQTESSLAKINWSEYEEILFLSKSIGTAVATAYAQNHNIICRNIYYTPLAQTFDFAPQSGIVFHGTKDSWVQTTIMKDNCLTHHLPLHIIEDVNHSLELDLPSSERHHPIRSNVQILEHVMALSEAYIAHNIYYRVLCVDEICRALFHDFIRHQKVGKCWRRDNEKWIIKEARTHEYRKDQGILLRCQRNLIQQR